LIDRRRAGGGGRGYPPDDYDSSNGGGTNFSRRAGVYAKRDGIYSNDMREYPDSGEYPGRGEYPSRQYAQNDGAFSRDYNNSYEYQNEYYYPDEDEDYRGDYQNYEGDYPPNNVNWSYDDRDGRYYDHGEEGYRETLSPRDEGQYYEERGERERGYNPSSLDDRDSSFDNYRDEDRLPKDHHREERLPPLSTENSYEDEYEGRDNYDTAPVDEYGNEDRFDSLPRYDREGVSYEVDVKGGEGYRGELHDVRGYDKHSVDSVIEYNNSFEEDRATYDSLERADTINTFDSYDKIKEQEPLAGDVHPVVSGSFKESGYQTPDRKHSIAPRAGERGSYSAVASKEYPLVTVVNRTDSGGMFAPPSQAVVTSGDELKPQVTLAAEPRRGSTHGADFGPPGSPNQVESTRRSGDTRPGESTLQGGSFNSPRFSPAPGITPQMSSATVVVDRPRDSSLGVQSFDERRISMTDPSSLRRSPEISPQHAASLDPQRVYDSNFAAGYATQFLPPLPSAGHPPPRASLAGHPSDQGFATLPLSPGDLVGDSDRSMTVSFDLRVTDVTGYIHHS